MRTTGLLQREAARLRQRLVVIQQRLRQWATEEGLLSSPSSTAAGYSPAPERPLLAASAPALE
jgi:hypothetical protein